ncbi:MAG: GldG family protein [Ruminococcus sp.]|nr:GldG family protein [Ruminococcus sp.]
MNKVNKKKLKYGSIAFAITVVIIALAVVLNVVLSILSDKYSLKVDITKEKLYAISDTTTDYLKNLNKDVEIVVTMSKTEFENDPYLQYAQAIFEKFENITEHVTVKYVDIMKNPEQIAVYQKNYDSTIDEYQIIVSAGTRVKVYSVGEIVNIEMDYNGEYTITGINVESIITPAIMSVTDANPKNVAIITSDMGVSAQNSLTQLENLLDINGYSYKNVDLLTENLGDEYDMAVVFAPAIDFTKSSTDKLQDFLENGEQYGKYMLYVASAVQTGGLPNLTAFLDEWGVKIGNNMLMETNDNLSQYVSLSSDTAYYFPLGNIMIEDYSSKLDSLTKPLVLPICGDVEILWESNGNRKVESLVSTSDSCVLMPMDGTVTLDELDTLPKSSHSAATLTTKTWADASGTDVRTSKMMVMGGESLLDPYVISDSSYNNSDFVIKAINTMVGKENVATFSPKSILPPTIDVSLNEYRVIQILVLCFIPLIVIVTGIVIYVKRRNR